MLIKKTFIDFGGNVYVFEKVDKLPTTKENAFLHGIAMFCRSWTFERLSADEKERCINSFLFAEEQKIIKGSYRDRIQIMNAIYSGFLSGLGYSGVDWREEEYKIQLAMSGRLSA